MIRTQTSQPDNALVAALLPRILWLLCLPVFSACTDPQTLQSQALETAGQWFDEAKLSQLNDSQAPDCHAFGLVKFTDASCDEMVYHAGQLDAATRQIESVNLLECFGQGGKEVCGEFAEIWFNTETQDGIAIREGMVLKRDNEAYRVYWYRSDTLFTAIADRADRAEAQTTNGRLASKQAELEAAYTQIVERDPGVYTYPACIDARVSSSAIVGDLMVLSSVTTRAMESRASQCSVNLCIALVGKRIAALCL